MTFPQMKTVRTGFLWLGKKKVPHMWKAIREYRSLTTGYRFYHDVCGTWIWTGYDLQNVSCGSSKLHPIPVGTNFFYCPNCLVKVVLNEDTTATDIPTEKLPEVKPEEPRELESPSNPEGKLSHLLRSRDTGV